MKPERSLGPCLMVILGAAGDLTKRKLLPALMHLAQENRLPEEFAILGLARGEFTDETYREKVRQDVVELEIAVDAKVLEWIVSRIYFVRGDLDAEASYDTLQQRINEIEPRHRTQGNRLFYLAILPKDFEGVVLSLAKRGLCNETGSSWVRVVVEKPFGRSYDTAHALNKTLLSVLKESQIYRIDHYLGKETVQNIMALRFGNSIFEPIWNYRYVDHVQISAAETLGIENRGPFYEGAGALRDMMSNHLFQLLMLTAMEPPISFDAESVRDEKMKALRAVKPLSGEEVLLQTVRGQYGKGLMEGKPAAAYREEDRVDQQSFRETYAAIKLHLDNWRWSGVPFYLRTGKRLAARVSEICIQFKEPPLLLFRDTQVKSLQPNTLVIRIQPDEGIKLSFSAKVPGPGVHLGEVDMDFDYAKAFGKSPNTGYETLLFDCMIGDATQFQRADMAEASWKVMDSILGVWEAIRPINFPNYVPGSNGPEEADALMSRDGRRWRPLQ
jgi:glucose-6-phosphate 1-dehydrogenase